MRIALLQLDPTVGALDKNVDALLKAVDHAHAQGAGVAVTSELAVCGYPPRDLLDRPAFVRAIEAANERLVRGVPKGLTLIAGTVRKRAANFGRVVENVALVIEQAEVIAVAVKQLLPMYDVFDEGRYFEPGTTTLIAATAAGRVAVSICEDAWNDDPYEGPTMRPPYLYNPLSGIKSDNTDLLVNLSASPFTLSKRVSRPARFAAIAQRHHVPVALVNQVGANDELLFDGRSTLYGVSGAVLARAAAFEPDFMVADTQSPAPNARAPDLQSDEEAAYRALITGIRGYARKCGFRSAVLGLSGGIDSALVASLAADALGPEHILGVALPSRYSSEGSRSDAAELAKRLGIHFQEISIDPMFATYLQELGPALDALQPPHSDDVTLENLQSRIRGAVLMAVSNRTGALLLTTGNKSELAVGYATIYGDMCGGLAVISDVPKTLVWKLARWVNREQERIPEASIVKAPSAELRPDQKDQDSLPPYDLLDRILELHIEEGWDRAALLHAGLDPSAVEHILKLVTRNEYKRRQAAPGLILTKKAFGVGRRMPIAQDFRE